MPYTGNPANSAADELRFKLGDITSPHLFSDAEISYLLASAQDSVPAAAVAGADQLTARFASLCDKTVGDLSIKYSQRAKQYSELARKLRQDLSITSAAPFCGGISISDKTRRYGDRDKVPPQFYRDLHTSATDE